MIQDDIVYQLAMTHVIVAFFLCVHYIFFSTRHLYLFLSISSLSALPYPTLPYPTLPYPTLPYSTLSHR